jgi:hypothetical protein
MRTSPKLGLRIWNLLLDPYDHEQLADNWAKVDAHDHSPGRGVLIPTEGIAFEAISYPLIASSVFPVASATGGSLTLSTPESKILAGGPELTVPATGEYEIGLTLTGEAPLKTFAHLEAFVSKGSTEKTAFKLFNWATEAAENAAITTTNFARGELKEGEKLTVWCTLAGAGNGIFSAGRIVIWRVA